MDIGLVRLADGTTKLKLSAADVRAIERAGLVGRVIRDTFKAEFGQAGEDLASAVARLQDMLPPVPPVS